jgi:hypothetical protein
VSAPRRDAAGAASRTAIDLLAESADRAFRGRGWQGPTLMGALHGVTAAQAATRPAVGRRSMWEQALHAAYWTHAIACVLERAAVLHAGGEADDYVPPKFPRSPINWPRVPAEADSAAWRADRELLVAQHERALRACTALDDEAMSLRPTPQRGWTVAQYLMGLAAHHAYHCGQVRWVKKAVRAARSKPAR